MTTRLKDESTGGGGGGVVVLWRAWDYFFNNSFGLCKR